MKEAQIHGDEVNEGGGLDTELQEAVVALVAGGDYIPL